MKKLLLALGCVLFFWQGVDAQRIPVLDFFHGRECPHCIRQKKWFPELKEAYPDIQINEYEVWHDPANAELARQRLRDLGTEFSGVPANVIGEDVIVGFSKNRILSTLEKYYGPPQNQTKSAGNSGDTADADDANWWQTYLSFPWPIMAFVLGLIDGFNPCAMWSLLVLIGFLLSIESKRRRWLIGGIFLGSSAILYFGALLAYLLGFSTIATVLTGGGMTWVFRIVGVVAVGAAVTALISAVKGQNECTVTDGKTRKKFSAKIAEVLERKNFWWMAIGLVGLAFSVNAIELLCSFAIPTAFTSTLVSSGIPFWQQLTAIFIYDVAYILDDVIVFTLAMWTLNIKMLSGKFTQISHWVGGILLLIIGVILIVNPEFLATLIA
jgi:hypothetical protein